MIVVGITGPIGHGKSTLARLLCELEPSSIEIETSHLISELANRLHLALPTPTPTSDTEVNSWLEVLPEIIEQCLYVKTSFSQLAIKTDEKLKHPELFQKLYEYLNTIKEHPELIDITINEQNKPYFRALLQWLGAYLPTRISNDLWYTEIVKRLKTMQVNLAVVGGVRYPVDAETLRQTGGIIVEIIRPGMGVADISDPTEKYREQVKPDCQLFNDGSLEDLQRIAEKLLVDLQSNQLQLKYSAK